MPFIHRIGFVTLVAAGVTSCHALSPALAADSPKLLTPSVDIEVEDKGPSGPSHLARFNVSLLDGHGEITAYDGDGKYAFACQSLTTAEPKVQLNLKRQVFHDRTVTSEFDIHGAIPQAPGVKVILAQIDRADGRSTTIIARAR